MKEIQVTKYESVDGGVFETKEGCAKYELRQAFDTFYEGNEYIVGNSTAHDLDEWLYEHREFLLEWLTQFKELT